MATDIQDVHTDNFDEMVLSAQRPVLLEFYATWCASCRRLAPVLERLAAEFAAQVAVMRVNVDENPALVDRFGVSAAPTLVMVIAGEESVRMVGAHAEPAIRELIATTLDRQPACTLPTAQQPMRVAEFDDLLADAVT